MQCHHQSFWLFGEGFLISFAVSPALTAMQPLRPSFCAPYQLARQVKGRPMCPHTKQACPYGLHACQLCGKGGHGAGDCRLIASPPTPLALPSREGPEPQQIAPPPTPPAAVPAPSAKPAPAQPQELSVIVPGFGRKGEGKGANYGVAIAPPTVVAFADLPAALQQPSSSSLTPVDQLRRAHFGCPSPLPATSELVEQWITGSYHRLQNISKNLPPATGETCLWRGVKTGRRGHPSTKVEYFQGQVRHVEVDSDHEIWVYID